MTITIHQKQHRWTTAIQKDRYEVYDVYILYTQYMSRTLDPVYINGWVSVVHIY